MKLKVKMNFVQISINILGTIFICIGAKLFIEHLCQSAFWESYLDSASLMLRIFMYVLVFAVQLCIMSSFIWCLNWGLAAIFGRKAFLDQNLYAVKAEPLVEYQPCSVRVKSKGKAEIFLTLAEEDVASICDQDDRNRRLLFKGVFPLGDTEPIELYLTWAAVKQVGRLLRYISRCLSLHCHYFQFTFETELPRMRSSVKKGLYVVLFRWDLMKIAQWCASDDGYRIECQASVLTISSEKFSRYQTILQILPENVGLRIPLA